MFGTTGLVGAMVVWGTRGMVVTGKIVACGLAGTMKGFVIGTV